MMVIEYDLVATIKAMGVAYQHAKERDCICAGGMSDFCRSAIHYEPLLTYRHVADYIVHHEHVNHNP